jgi:predicted porin
MIGGLSKTASRLALAAVLGAVGAVVFVQKPVKAADLGGDCCADLEERVAELEATTVRKGNKKVSVIVYGKVNYATEFWDDGHEKNMYTVNNAMESTRWGFKGSAKISDDWSAGFRIEMENRGALSQQLNQFNDDNAFDTNGAINVRWSHIYLASKKWGEARLGLTATPKYDVTKDTMEYISTESGEGGGLSDTLVPDFRMNDSFLLREKGFNNAEGLAGALGGRALTWSNIARCYSAGDQFNCSTRRNGIAYWSPTWNGFSASWGTFEDHDWSAAVRYRNTFNDTWALAASAGYEKFRDERLQAAGGGLAGFQRDFDEWAGSAALKHKPSGLFVMGVWGVSDSSDTNVKGAFNGQGAPQMTDWNVQGGLQRKLGFLGNLGESALWGGYSDVHDGFAPGSSGINSSGVACCQAGALGVAANMLLPANTFPSIPFSTQVTSSDVTTWFIAADQQLSAAAMHVYIAYEHFDADLSLIDSTRARVPINLDDFDLVYAGGRIYF